jgi:Holliday junction resolvase
MSNYQKGARFERDIVTELWGRGWTAVRAAGSGSVGYPVPDVVGMRDGELIAIECKSSRKNKVYLEEAIMNLKVFADISGARAYIGVKFLKKKPMFFNIRQLIAEKHYNLSVDDPHLTLDVILGEQAVL